MALDFAFVPAIEERNLRASLAAALEFVRDEKGHLAVCHLEQRYPSNDTALAYWQADTVKALEARAAEEKEALETLFYGFCGEHGIEVTAFGAASSAGAVTASWTSLAANPFENFAQVARPADVAVLARAPDEPSPLTPSVREDLLVASGIPLLNVPSDKGFRGARKVLVGWNGTVEAKRAVSAAMPLLGKASAVDLVSFGLKDGDSPSAEQMAMVLRRKGVSASGNDRKKSGSAGEELSRAAMEGAYDLLVIGGYSQPRWRESLFGGVTQNMLAEPPLPVLIVH